jgi:crotonobetainyl-CoA:carnitine CoA-transferase CaiB-like acyl-CoA transferase
MTLSPSICILRGLRVVEMGQQIAGPFADETPADFAAIGVLMPLHHRTAHGGPGQMIDMALHEASRNVMEGLLPEYSAFGAVHGGGISAGGPC